MNLCDTCPVLSKRVCPILEIAYRKGHDGMERCEMNEIIVELIEDTKKNAKKAKGTA